MTDKHTPGPWHIEQRWPGYHGAEIRAGEMSLADLRINEHNATHGMANAQLIAAAPDMLAVLQTLTREGVSLELYAAARAAIDKATS